MKILHVVRSLAVGGAERMVVELATHHSDSRFRSEVCCVVEDGALAGPLRDAGVPVHVLGRKSRFDLGAIMRLAKLITGGGFDVVHNHGFAAVSVGAPASVLAGTSGLVRTEHNVVHDCPRLELFVSRVIALAEDAQIAVADAVRQSNIAHGRIPRAHMITIPNGISGERLTTTHSLSDVRAELGIPADVTVVLSIGALTPQKDHGNLLRAASKLVSDGESISFLLAGAGPMADETARAVRELGLGGHVHLLGRRLDVASLFRAADIFVMSSAWEGFPIVLLEAMASGVPCVATGVGGVEELIEHEATGIVVRPRDSDALAEGIRRLAGDEDLRASLGRAGREKYLAGFTARQMARETEALYSLASSGRADLAARERIGVLYVIGQLGHGGSERQLLELATRLDPRTYDVVVCSLSSTGRLFDAFERNGVRVVSLDKKPGIGIGSLLKLARLVREVRPTVIHSYLFSANWRTLIVGRLLRVPLVMTSVRNVDIHSRAVLRIAERALSLLTDRVIANAQAVKDYVSRHHGTPEDRIRVIYNGVSISRIRSAAATSRDRGSGEGEIGRGRVSSDHGTTSADAGSVAAAASRGSGGAVTIIGSLVPKKDHGTFLEAARIVSGNEPETRYVAVGEGRLRGELERLASDLGLSDAITFVGRTDDVAGVLFFTDVLVLTSLKEGCANVILEAMAAGKPVVATDVGGNAELVVDGLTGFIVPAGDGPAVAEKVLELLGDDDMRARMGEAALARIEEMFTVEKMVEETTAFYREIIEERIPGLMEWIDARGSRSGALRRRPSHESVSVVDPMRGAHVGGRATASG